jgi:hypothetical protein
VIGWPSTEKEFSAWSPSPWNRPFESAATPGVESVTRELTDEEALSSGRRSKSLRIVFREILAAFHRYAGRTAGDRERNFQFHRHR